jgi:hypothetical protein
MAIRDAVSTPAGAKTFVNGFADWLDGPGDERDRFERWVEAAARLPRRQTRVVTWPVLTVFGFIARPDTHIFLKPMVTKRAAERFGFDFRYSSRPHWDTYSSLLEFASVIRSELADWQPRDMIDVQSVIWVLGSAEYDEAVRTVVRTNTLATSIAVADRKLRPTSRARMWAPTASTKYTTSAAAVIVPR